MMDELWRRWHKKVEFAADFIESGLQTRHFVSDYLLYGERNDLAESRQVCRKTTNSSKTPNSL